MLKKRPLKATFGTIPYLCLCLSACFLMLSCVHLQSISLTSIPESRDSVVQAKESEMIYLGIVTSNDFVDDVARTLGGQCQGGRIQGILTKHYTTTFIPWILVKRTVEARGYCSLAMIDHRTAP